MELLELATRLGAAAIAASAIGFEREVSDKPAGLRTHLLVALGSATFILISEIGLSQYDPGEKPPNLDRMRTLAGLIGGIGFLGAGAIIQDRFGVKGLTTAASLWTAAALGAAAGFGFYDLTILATLFALVILVPLQLVERFVNPKDRSKLRNASAANDPDPARSAEGKSDPPPARP